MQQAELAQIAFRDIRLNAYGLRNFRHRMEDLDILVNSIRENGLQLPLTVWEVQDPETEQMAYVLAAGFRRHAAISKIREENPDAFELLSVVLLNGTLDEAIAKNIEENLQRCSLAAADEILAVAALYERVGDQTEVGRMVGRSQPWVSGKLKIHKNLIPRGFSALRTEQINLPQAKRLAEVLKDDGTPDEEAQNAILDRLLESDDDGDLPMPTQREKTHRTKKEVQSFAEELERLMGEVTEPHHRDRLYTLESCKEWLQCEMELRDLIMIVQPTAEEDPGIVGVV